MTIDEAIKHCEEVMMENLEKTKDRNASDPIAINCFECAEEHRQLAEWLKDYKRLLEQDPSYNSIKTELEPCEDAVSRQAVLDGLASIAKVKAKSDAQKSLMGRVIFFVEQVPPVTPQPKMGHWIKTPKAVMGEGYMWYCDKCEHKVYQDSSKPYPSEKYCPNCGQPKMQEVEE